MRVDGLTILLGLVVLGSGLWASPRPHVKKETQASAWLLSEKADGPGRHSLRVALDGLEVLAPGDSLAFELPNGGLLRGVVRRCEARSTVRYALSGDFGSEGNFVLAINQGVLASFLHDPAQGIYRVRLTPGQVQVIEPVAASGE